MFYFQQNPEAMKDRSDGAVVLRIARHDGDGYRNLTPEVFLPCEIRCEEGNIQFNWPEDQHRTKSRRYQVSLLLAQIIKAFFVQPKELAVRH